ncbi:hypothetical protein FA95DRAFT_619973 [Auriscalpium vulgare]|uniref:Uncharacterized protein n=1 Tax=Auriscalpium vulgare TaxID=40419 RepID=A0ACB8S2S8_9AGAM|nr:hypothetical protein FA95DRAFT_619973 [Auriscalpium vulgare]
MNGGCQTYPTHDGSSRVYPCLQINGCSFFQQYRYTPGAVAESRQDIALPPLSIIRLDQPPDASIGRRSFFEDKSLTENIKADTLNLPVRPPLLLRPSSRELQNALARPVGRININTGVLAAASGTQAFLSPLSIFRPSPEVVLLNTCWLLSLSTQSTPDDQDWYVLLRWILRPVPVPVIELPLSSRRCRDCSYLSRLI